MSVVRSAARRGAPRPGSLRPRLPRTRSALLTGLVSIALVGPVLPAAAAPGPAPAGSLVVPGPRVVWSEPARAQVTWLLQASTRVPVPAGELTAHLSPALLAAVGGPAGFDTLLASVAGPAGLVRTRDVQLSPIYAQVVATGSAPLLVQLATGPDQRITSLLLSPWAPEPRTAAEASRRLAAVAPRTSALIARVDGNRCIPLRAGRATVARPLGSAFKLWVLGALGRAVADGRTSWTEQLPIRADRLSLPSGTFQTLPVGTRLPVSAYADAMISMSDNTATDHLVGRLGRPAVEQQFALFGAARPAANTPLLTTRDLFVLKGSPQAPQLRALYDVLTPDQRRVLLERVVPTVPLASVVPWTTPIGLDDVEWSASPTDVCRAFAGLARQAAEPGLAPIGAALSINDGAIGLSRTAFPTVWFKGGSEPGVLTLNTLVRDASGRTFVSSVMASDPGRALRADATAELTAIARAGLLDAASRP